MKRVIAMLLILALASMLCACDELFTITVSTEQVVSELPPEPVSDGLNEAEGGESSKPAPVDYRDDREITIGGKTYTLHYIKTDGEAERRTYETDAGEEFIYDSVSDKLLSFNVRTDEAGAQISEQAAVDRAEAFFSTLCDLSQFECEEVEYNAQLETFYITYVHRHLGYVAESMRVSLEKDGQFRFYTGQFDRDGTFFSYKEIDPDKAFAAMEAYLGDISYRLAGTRQTSSEEGHPCFEYMIVDIEKRRSAYKETDGHGYQYSIVVVEVYPDGTYFANSEVEISCL